MNRFLKVVFLLFSVTGLGALLFRMSRRRVRVLMYHGVCAPEGVNAPFNGRGKHQRADRFRRQMRWLRRHAHLMSIEDLVERLESGASLPDRGVVVTLDDGYRNNHDHALPVLAEHQVPAAVYVTTGFVEGRPFWTDRIDDALENTTQPTMTVPGSAERWSLSTSGDRRRAAARFRRMGKRIAGDERERLVAEVTRQAERDLARVPSDARPADTRAMTIDMLRTLRRGGVTIGSHTVSHEILSRTDDERLRRELGESRRRLEEWLGVDVVHFAYPNGAPGDFDDRTEAAARAAGYRSALLTVHGSVRRGDSPFRIRRLPVNGDEGLPELIADLCGLRPALVSLKKRVLGR